MDTHRDGKRKKDKYDEEDERRRHKKSRRPRSRSRSYEDHNKESRRRRRRSDSRSRDDSARDEKRGRDAPKEPEPPKEAPARPERRAKETDMLNTRTGGAYIPPARLRMMQAQITDKSSMAYQRLAWEALKKSIHGHINKINVGNIGIIIKELLKENIVRGRGLLCRSVIQAQAASPTFTNVYAALVSAVNSRFPNIGELLLKRLVIQFKRGFKRNDKSICISAASFIAHLVNQRVAHEILALELLTLLVESPTDDSVEVAIAFLKECGQKLTEVSSKGVNAIFEMLRNILHEGQLDKRVQYMIEVMFQVWKDGFKDHPALIEELELVPEEEQFTHLLMLDDATDPQDILNVFKFDDKYEENEQKYKNLSKEILGSDAESGSEEGSGESGSEESDDEDEEQPKKEMTIIDNTETNLIALRRTIYLTINSSLDFEECAHKLMKMQLKPGQEVELCHMFLDCCAEQRTYEKFYGLLAQRFCNINRIYIGPFEEIFKDSYSTAHRLDTNRLRNVSKFFAHLLFTDSISWEALECVKLNEEDTTSSSRIYIKILFQELAEYMGLKKLNERLQDPTLQEAFSGIFPRDNPRNTRFSINFFTSIGLGGLTDELREFLKQMPKNVPAPPTDIKIDSESSSESSSDSSSSSSSDSSSSDSEEEKENKKKKKEKKSKKEKTQEAEKEQDKNVERWGHEGFYDTYGKDARRYETNRDNDNFNRPRDRNNREYTNRNGHERNNRPDDGYSRPDMRRVDRKRDYEDRDGRRNRDYDDGGNERDDRRIRRQNEDEGRSRRQNEDEGRSRRQNEDEGRNRRQNEDEGRSHRQNEDEERSRRQNEDERGSRRQNEADGRSRRQLEEDEGRRDQPKNYVDDSRQRRFNEMSEKRKDNSRDDRRNGGDEDRDDRRNRRDNENDSRRNREDNERYEGRNRKDYDRNRDDERNRRDDERSNRRNDESNDRSNRKYEERDDRSRRDDRRDDRRERRNNEETDETRDQRSDKRNREDDYDKDDRRNQRDNERSTLKDKRKDRHNNEDTSRSRNTRDDKENRRNVSDDEHEVPKDSEVSSKKAKDKRKEKDESSDDDNKRKKDKKKNKTKDDSSGEDRPRKTKKDKRKKKSKKDSDDSEHSDEWERDSPDVKEVSGRYWDACEPTKEEGVRKERKRERSRQRS